VRSRRANEDSRQYQKGPKLLSDILRGLAPQSSGGVLWSRLASFAVDVAHLLPIIIVLVAIRTIFAGA